MHCKEPEKLCIKGNLRVPTVSVDSVKKIGLFIIIRCKDDIVNNPL